MTARRAARPKREIPPPTSPAPPARRINRGRGHSYAIDGAPAVGVTTVIDKSIPKKALTGWAAREVSEFIIARRRLLADDSWTDEELLDLMKGAPFRERDKAANRGTEVHRLAEQLARGKEVEVPDELVGHVDSYVAFLDQFRPTDALLERPVFNRTYRYGGTLDLLCSIEDLGHRCLIDIKTNRSGPFGETALQLAAYGRSEFMVDVDGLEVPMPEIDFFGVVWVRADGYDLYPYQVTDREWKQFLYCLQTAWWMDHRAEHVKGDALWRRQEVKP